MLTVQIARKRYMKKYNMTLSLYVGEWRLPDTLEVFFKDEP